MLRRNVNKKHSLIKENFLIINIASKHINAHVRTHTLSHTGHSFHSIRPRARTTTIVFTAQAPRLADPADFYE